MCYETEHCSVYLTVKLGKEDVAFLGAKKIFLFSNSQLLPEYNFNLIDSKTKFIFLVIFL